MAQASEIIQDATRLFGTGASLVHLDTTDWIEALNWAISSLNRELKLLTAVAELDLSDREDIPTPADYQGVMAIFRRDTMRQLLKTEFSHLVQRRPNFKTTTKPARFWAFTQANQLVIDGDPGSDGVELHYLQNPTPVTGVEEEVDARLGQVNIMAFAYLAAAYCMQTAGDAASLERARGYQSQGFALAGVKRRARTEVVSDGGERVASGE